MASAQEQSLELREAKESRTRESEVNPSQTSRELSPCSDSALTTVAPSSGRTSASSPSSSSVDTASVAATIAGDRLTPSSTTSPCPNITNTASTTAPNSTEVTVASAASTPSSTATNTLVTANLAATAATTVEEVAKIAERITAFRVQPEEINLIYFVVGDKSEIALVPTNSSSDDIKELFRSAAEAGPFDIVKLYTLEGRLINISPRIPPNSPSSPYRLEVVAVHCNGILMEQVGIDLLSLEKRVSALERILKNQGSPCDSIQELKEEVNQLRHKLENYEHLSWLGFYKALHPPPLPAPPRPPGVGYHRKSRDDKQVICDKFLQLSDVVLTRETCQLLREPTFDNWQWEDEEMLVLLQQMYLDLELPRKFDIEISILRNFLVNVYHHYNDVPFHNFRHCFCVTQMMFGMACYVNLAERVGDLEVLILLTSCICHDLDHPGYNNIYQINAQTELALRYNDISPLENHHCSIAFRILEDPECNIFRNLPVSTFRKIREGIIRCILATDMARHNEIVNQFREIVPYFDSTNKTHINLLSMVLIKVADISNEARPMDVAEPWLDCLLAEFFQQSDTEKLEGLPVTPFMDRDKITKPSSQCSFIGLVLLPLFEALGSFFPELEPLIIQPVRDALEYYRRLNEAAQVSRQHRKSTDVGLNAAAGGPLMAPPPATASSSSSVGALTPGMTMTISTPSGTAFVTFPSSQSTTVISTSSTSCLTTTTATNNLQQPELLPDQESNLCNNKIPSDPCNMNRVSRSNSVSNYSSERVEDPGASPTSSSIPRNPITIAHRRASQLLVRGSGSVTSLKSANTGRSSKGTGSGAPGHFTSFPSLESDSEREGGDSEEDDDAITEVAVSEKALKFKIATESSIDFSSTSRKSSRENKSESSGQSGNSQSAMPTRVSSKDPVSSSSTSLTPTTSYVPMLGGAGGGGVSSTLSEATCSSSVVVSDQVASSSSEMLSPSFPDDNQSTSAGSAGAKAKAKDSFFTRLKLLTERLSISADSGGSGGSGGGSPTYNKSSSQGFSYFRRSGRKVSKAGVSLKIDDRSGSSGSAVGGRSRLDLLKHRGSNSDPEGRDEIFRRHHTIHTTSEHHTMSEGERELVSPECSPALSRSSATGTSTSGSGTKACKSSSSWKQCSGSLDSILSKDEPKRSPGRRLMLPRFSSFVHKRTRMGFMRRLSPKSGDHPS